MSAQEFGSIAINLIWALGYSFVLYIFFILVSAVWMTSGSSSRSLTNSSNRFGCLDGLRGVLAVGVFVHHSYVGYLYFLTGTWSWSNNPILDNLGQATVALFFMITAYLFTTKLINSGERLSFLSVYIGRVFRLFPLYFLVISLVVFVVAFKSDWQLNEPLTVVVGEMLRWYAFVLFGRPEINGVIGTSHIIAGVNWTLRFEWLFYLFLPVIYYSLKFSTRFLKLQSLALILIGLVIILNIVFVAPSGLFYIFCYFALGTASAMLRPWFLHSKITFGKWIDLIPLMAVILVFSRMNCYNLLSIISLFVILFFVLDGYSYFGLLSRKSMIWLGDISYGIYLIHGFVLYCSYSAIRYFQAFDLINIYWFFVLMFFNILAIFFLSSASYIWMELPLMKMSKNIKFGLRS